jgi:perosamine synthetase
MKTESTEGRNEVDAYTGYMARIGRETIPAYEPTLGDEELALLTDVIKRNWLSEGKYVREFEDQLARISERAHALAFCNATAALISGMRACGIGEGDEVIVPSFTHSADPNAIADVGAHPVFTDVEEQSLCLSVDTIEPARTSRTRAILFVSLYGNVSRLEDIVSYAEENSLLLINDCAPALYGSYQGRSIASYGNFSVLSFFADKTITTGEGGMLLADDEELIKESSIYKHDGRRERGHDLIERVGYNFRMTEMQAAIGVAQLQRIEEFVQRKRANQVHYLEQLANIPEVRVFQFNPEADPVPHRTLIFVPDAPELIDYLTRRGIGVRSTFMPMHSQPCYSTGQDLQVTEHLFATGVCLPSAPTLTEEQIVFICDSIRDFYITKEE